MAIAAIPEYLGRHAKDFQHASPGLRFGMYLPIWKPGLVGKVTDDKVSDYKAMWRNITRLNPADQKLMQALGQRQRQQAATLPPASLYFLAGQAVAPFTTGLGNEHPTENGFAFLNPYGLPYLPGSGVKGVLRQAARELIDDGQTGWTDDVLRVLFGHADEERAEQDALPAMRGVLSFWDVLPEIHGDQLGLEIMTPHQSHYYQQKVDRKAGDSASPHDSGQPVPITFLTVPPKSAFRFHVQCDLRRLKVEAPALLQNEHWRELLQSAFEYAFEWLGFGAKTAVGYGQMSVDQTIAREQEKQAEARRFAEMSPLDQAILNVEKIWQEEQSLNRKQPGGPLDNEITLQIKQAVDWELEDRHRLAEVCREAMKWLGKPGKKIRQKLSPLNLPEG